MAPKKKVMSVSAKNAVAMVKGNMPMVRKMYNFLSPAPSAPCLIASISDARGMMTTEMGLAMNRSSAANGMATL